MLCLVSLCGQPALNTRIVGGEEASPGSWPWMVSLHISRWPRCGGSLINDQWVLTVARCVYWYSPSSVTVYLGRQSQEGSNPNEVMRKVDQIISHPDYYNYNNDIALVKLSEPVSFTSYISPVCLAASDSTISTGVNTWITGWGDTENGDPLPSPKNLMEAEVEVVENSQCSFFWFSITDNMMCAESQDGGKGFCWGDYGGPLVSKQCDRWIQLGIANEHQGCSQNTYPGAYTRVSLYESWINSVISTTQPSFISFTSTDSCPPKREYLCFSSILM
uniref:Peptidase S1 domain-containing protein n=1 Tax=Fundulus heteroclitus TaxID=8078 RepID=A0A3Q2SPP9_FUNHE